MIQRLYREEKLTVRRRGGRKRALGLRRPSEAALAPNQRWSLDFVSDQLTDARRFRILAVVDDCTRDPGLDPGLTLVADTSLSGRGIVRSSAGSLRWPTAPPLERPAGPLRNGRGPRLSLLRKPPTTAQITAGLTFQLDEKRGSRQPAPHVRLERT